MLSNDLQVAVCDATGDAIYSTADPLNKRTIIFKTVSYKNKELKFALTHVSA